MSELAEILENFALFDDWEERYQYIIDLGKNLPHLPEDLKTDVFKVRGCTSQVWLIPETNQNQVFTFRADSDALIVRGLIAIILAAYNDKSGEEILATDIDAIFTQMGLEIINGKTSDAAIEDDIEVLEKLLKIIRAAGVTGYKIHFVLARGRKISQPKAIIPLERLARIIPPDPDAMIAGRSGEDIIRRIERSRHYHAQRAEQQNEEDSPDDSLAMDWMETVASALDLQTNDFETFGQSGGFDYYTGVSFEIHVPELGPRKVIASGGRYDNLVESLGAPHQIPAVGGAIALERLREAAGR